MDSLGYLDYNATTPTDPKVFEAMEPFFKTQFGNASSINYQWGWQADHAVKKAREQVAQLLGANANEINFTSGATESNNWTLFGLLNKLKMLTPNQEIHILTTQTEHSSVLNPLKEIEKIWKNAGVQVDYLPVRSDGRVDIVEIEKALRPSTKLISTIWVNNEIGSINEIEKIGSLARKNKIYFHTDATQALGKFEINLAKIPIDIMSFSGHKIYGPKGVGGLYVRRENPNIELSPLLFGGGQEGGNRSGTLNVPGIVGIGKACEILGQEMSLEKQRIEALRDDFYKRILRQFPKTRLNGPQSTEFRAYNNLNLTFYDLLDQFKEISFGAGLLTKLGCSAGSACTTGKVYYSHVLKSIGLSQREAQCTLRFSFGRMTTMADVDFALKVITSAF